MAASTGVYEGTVCNTDVNLCEKKLAEALRVGNNEENKSSGIIARFIADSGATEHLSRSKLFFNSLDESNKSSVRWANKESKLSISGIGDIKTINNNNELVLQNVLYSNDVIKRQFVDKGIKIFLHNEGINIYDPVSRKSLVRGIYKSSF